MSGRDPRTQQGDLRGEPGASQSTVPFGPHPLQVGQRSPETLHGMPNIAQENLALNWSGTHGIRCRAHLSTEPVGTNMTVPLELPSLGKILEKMLILEKGAKP